MQNLCGLGGLNFSVLCSSCAVHVSCRDALLAGEAHGGPRRGSWDLGREGAGSFSDQLGASCCRWGVPPNSTWCLFSSWMGSRSPPPSSSPPFFQFSAVQWNRACECGFLLPFFSSGSEGSAPSFIVNVMVEGSI